MRCEDVISMPPVDELGIACQGDFVLRENAEFQYLYLTPQTQKYSIGNTGDVDERLFKKEVSGSYPGNDIQIFEFIKKHINQGFIVVYKEDCEPYSKIFGSPKNPLFLSPNYKSDSTGKGYEITLQQNKSDNIPVLFYNGEFPVSIEDEGIVEIIDIIGQPIEGPYKSRRIYLIGAEPTGSDLEQFFLPVIFRICSDGKSIDVTYDKDGNRYSGADAADKANIDASNIDPHIAAWRAKLIQEPEDPTEEETASAPHSRTEDGWRTINNVAPANIVLGNQPEGSFHLTGTGDITGFTTKMGKFMWPGRGMILYTEHAVTLKHQPQEPTTNAKYFTFAEDFTTKPDGWYILKEKAGMIEVVELGGGSADFPEGNPGDVLVKGATEWEASDRLTVAESEIDAEVVNRAAADLTEKNERIAADALKVDKPTTDGTWVLQKVGAAFTWVTAVMQNIANTDLTNLSARIFTQGNTFTWNTAGFFHYLKGLLDKTGNAAYTKVVVVHPTTGEMVTRDFADPQATTLAVQNANATQKTAMRTALLGTATPANPVLHSCAPRFVERTTVYVDLYGINLTLLDPAFIWIERGDGSRIYAINFYNLTVFAVTTQWLIPSDLPNGDYNIKIQNGVAVQGLSTAQITVVDSIARVKLLNSDWVTRKRLDANGNQLNSSTIVTSDDYVGISGSNSTGYISGINPQSGGAKSQNIFLGNKDWDIDILLTRSDGGGPSGDYYPFIGLTETTNANFTDINNFIVNNVALYSSARMAGFTIGQGIDLVTFNKLYIVKNGSNLLIRMTASNNTTSNILFSSTIDTTKNYALFFLVNYQASGKTGAITARIIN